MCVYSVSTNLPDLLRSGATLLVYMDLLGTALICSFFITSIGGFRVTEGRLSSG